MIRMALTIGIRAVKEFRDVESAEVAADGASADDAEFSGVMNRESLVGTFCVALSEFHEFAPFSRRLLTLSHYQTSPLSRFLCYASLRMAAPLHPLVLTKSGSGDCSTPPPGR